MRAASCEDWVQNQVHSPVSVAVTRTSARRADSLRSSSPLSDLGRIRRIGGVGWRW